jgi:hypothetical protein
VARLGFSGTLSSSSVVYTYTAPDGTVVVFRPMGGGDCAPSRCAYASEVTDPDGTHYTLSYAASGVGSGDGQRLERVVSSRGYALILEGSGHEVTKACVLNLAVTTLPTSNVCPSGAQATSTYTYTSGNVGLATATGADGATSSFTYTWGTGIPATIGFIRPGETTPWLVNTIGEPFERPSYAPYSVWSQAFADGQSYTYSVEYGPMVHGTDFPRLGNGYIDGNGRGATLTYDWIVRPGYNQPGEPCTQFPATTNTPSTRAAPMPAPSTSRRRARCRSTCRSAAPPRSTIATRSPRPVCRATWSTAAMSTGSIHSPGRTAPRPTCNKTGLAISRG